MRIRLAALALALCLLTGCASLLEREYSTAEPHSSKFWESEAADTLRAENYQDIVNDLLLLIGQHTEAAALRLYNFEDDLTVADTLERAAVEIQQETPMGAYAVEYITSSSQAQRGYYEVVLQIGYRRTAEQIQAVVNATSTAGLYSLLEAALADGKTELAVRIGYWGQDGPDQVAAAMAQLRTDLGLPESPGWVVNYYPADGPVGLIEFLLDEEAVEQTDGPADIPAQPDAEPSDAEAAEADTAPAGGESAG
nr:hypothetical protein [uncultured Oscillibacter sp.]